MKIKTFILVALSLIALVIPFLCSAFLPLWASILIVCLSVLAISYLCIKAYYNITSDISNKTTCLNEVIELAVSKLDSQIKEESSKLSANIISTQEELTKRLEEGVASIEKDIVRQSSQITSSIEASRKLIVERLEEKSKMIIEATSNVTRGLGRELNDKMLSQLETTKSESERVMSSMMKESENSKNRLEDVSNLLKQEIDTNVESLKSRVNANLQELQDKVVAQLNNLSQDINGVSQETHNINNVIRIAEQNLALQTNSIDTKLESSVNEVKQQLVESEVKSENLMETSIAKVVTTFTGSFDEIKLSIANYVNQIQYDSKNVAESLTNRLDNINRQIDALGKYSNESSKRLLQNGKERFDVLCEEINSIKKSSENMSTLITDSINDSDAITKQFLMDVQKQCDDLNKRLNEVYIKTGNIDEMVGVLFEKNGNDDITASIKLVIDDLQRELKNAVSDINNQILDSQISQEATNDELSKLQVLLRTLLQSFDEKETKAITKQSNNQLVSQSENSISGTIVDTGKKGLNPNRLETIVDDVTKNTVSNQYQNNNLVKSTMRDLKGHIIYELEYVAGKIARSRNYDAKGNINMEQTFYDNGQVHYRNEFTKNGKKTTEFDINGKIK